MIQNWFQSIRTPQEPISVPQVPDNPSEILPLRRERDEIQGRLNKRHRILEIQRKLKDVWLPRKAELQPTYDEQSKRLAVLRKKTEGHPGPERRGNSTRLHCNLCTDLSVVEENVAAFKVALDSANHWIESFTREEKALTEIFKSVTGKERTRLEEIDKILEAQAKGHEPEKRLKVPTQQLPFDKEPVRKLGFGSNGLTDI